MVDRRDQLAVGERRGEVDGRASPAGLDLRGQPMPGRDRGMRQFAHAGRAGDDMGLTVDRGRDGAVASRRRS